MEGFGENLKRIRESRGKSQGDIADLLNVRRATVSSWETDRTEPRIEHLIKLGEYFDLTIDDMVNGRIYHIEVKPPREDTKEQPREEAKEALKTYFNKFMEILNDGEEKPI